MAIVFEIASTEQHFEQILQLQKQNLFNSLTEAEQEQQGFVFAEHTIALLNRMASQLPQIIALSDGKVIGYNLAMPVSMKNEIASLIPMFAVFDQSRYQDRLLNTYCFVVGGQVCIDKAFRGQGLLKKLYHETRSKLPVGYQLCVTEVSERNQISLNAHLKMGFEVISTYHDGKEQWKVVVWDLENVKD